MDPLLLVALGFGLFAATHLGLAWPPVRQRLVARLGRWRFTLLFALVAWLTFGSAFATYAAHGRARSRGPRWPRAGRARRGARAPRRGDRARLDADDRLVRRLCALALRAVRPTRLRAARPRARDAPCLLRRLRAVRGGPRT